MFSVNLEDKSISIHDEIGPAWWGLIDASMVQEGLDQMKGQHVTIRLNTPGGSVDEGINIFNALKRHKGGVTVIVDSLAASMGSYLLQAGEQRIVMSNSMVMIHDPWTITMGNATQLRKDADVLEKYALRMIPDYAARSGKSDDEILSIMADESWYAGQEIIDAGFADVMQSHDASAKLSPPRVAGLHRYCRKMPESLLRIRKDNQAAMKAAASAAIAAKKKTFSVEEAKLKALAVK